jgi:hypothetical protein
MKTNPSHQNITASKPTRRHFLAKGFKPFLAVILVGASLSSTKAEAASHRQPAYNVRIIESSTNKTTIKNGESITFRAKVVYQSVRNGPYDRPLGHHKVKLWVASRVVATVTTDANGYLNGTLPSYVYPYLWSGKTRATVGWHWDFPTTAPFRIARGEGLKFTVLK